MYGKEQVVFEEDDFRITATRDPELANCHNIGYCSIPYEELRGRVIKDVYYESTHFKRGDTWELDVTNVVITLEESKTSEITSMVVQMDPENNGGGYLALNTPKGSYRNVVEGKRHLENLGMSPSSIQ